MTTAPRMRRRLPLSAEKPTSGRIAATGGMRAARMAGTSTDSRVMPTPTIAATTTVRGFMSSGVGGNPPPAPLKAAMMPCATR